jgi:hypothetical protein
MKLLSLMTAAALVAGTGLASAQATNFSLTPGDAKSLSGSGTDVRDWRTVEQRRMMERSGNQGPYAAGMHMGWNAPGYAYGSPGYDRHGHRQGWNAYGAGVQVGPVGVGAGPYGAGVGIGPFGVGIGHGPWAYNHGSRWH